jgi:hypothetical protein
MRSLVAAALAFTLTGCIAQTALDVVSIPVKVVSAGVDAAITTEAEADQKRGRRLRKQEECMGKEARRAERARREPDYEKCEMRKR